MSHFLTVSLKRFLLLTVIALTPCAAIASPYVVKLVQQGNNVVAIGSGSFDLTGLTLNSSFSTLGDVPGLFASQADVSLGPVSAYTVQDAYTGITGPMNFGLGGAAYADSGSGDVVEITGNPGYWGVAAFFVPGGYLSGTALNSGAIWLNANLASLGVTPGTYTWTWGTGAEQSFTLVTSVPEPATLGMFGLGMLLICGFVTLRRREQRQS